MLSAIDQSNSSDKKISTIITLLIHALLLLCLFFITFKSPPPAEPFIEGMIVNLGNAEDGSGDEQPLRTGDFAPETDALSPSSSSSRASSSQIATNSGYMTQENVTTTGMTSSETPTEFTTNPNTNTEQNISTNNNSQSTSTSINNTPNSNSNTPQVNQNALFRAKNANGSGGNNSNTNNNSTSEGDGSGSGDKGAINGDPNANDYGDWSSDGSGVPLKMKNRKFTQKPIITDNSQETGTVILRIKVNKSGKVLSADFEPKGSTTSNTDLINKAKKAVRESYLNEGNLPEQIGFVKIVFKYKN